MKMKKLTIFAFVFFFILSSANVMAQEREEEFIRDRYDKEETIQVNEGGVVYSQSLLNLKEARIYVDLSELHPLELTMVPIKRLFVNNPEIVLSNKVAVKIGYGSDDYKIYKSSDKIDISGYESNLEIISGVMDQLEENNQKFTINVSKDYGNSNWLKSTIKGVEKKKSVNLDSFCETYTERIYINFDSGKKNYEYQAGLLFNQTDRSYPNISKLRFFEGSYASLKRAEKGREITKELEKNTFKISKTYEVIPLTIAAMSSENECIGIKTFYVSFYAGRLGITDSLKKKINNQDEYVIYSSKSTSDKNEKNISSMNTELILYKGYSVSDNYNFSLGLHVPGKRLNSEEEYNMITAIYKGKYGSIKEAEKDKAKNIKEEMMNDNYEYKFGKTNWFTVIVGKDGDKKQLVFQKNLSLVVGNVERYTNSIIDESNIADCNFNTLYQKGEDGKAEYLTAVKVNNDSYAEGNFVTFYVDEEVDLKSIALGFDLVDKKSKLYAAGSNVPEESMKSFHDFSKGSLQYTVSAENGKNSKSYWVRILKKEKGNDKLFINSLSDENAKKTVKDGVITIEREALLDTYHGRVHDITLVNHGEEAIPNLKVELSSNQLVLDKYWTLLGNYPLKNMTFGKKTTEGSYNEDYIGPYQAKVRLLPKIGLNEGANVSGTLTISSANKKLMVIKITGLVGDPVITTKKITKGVKFVPYGMIIQNSNKYSWNTPSYKVLSGKLPKGMKIKQNGELYGVPKEKGKFKFKVRLNNSYRKFRSSEKEFTLSILENTNANVEKAVDKGYELSKKIDNINLADSSKEFLMVSKGEYDNFVDIYLDGKKLKKDKDYSSEEGSTRITIAAQTLKKVKVGTHTLGLEFREKSTDELKKSAQNYDIFKGKYVKTKEEVKKEIKKEVKKKVKKEVEKNIKKENKKDLTKKTNKKNQKQKHNDTFEQGSMKYIIKTGDTLWELSERKYGTGLEWIRISKANDNINPRRLIPGKEIVLP